eukprot:CAMPEP_0194540630 /NCGR_PEP_ID=MMETSP0253-20130528/80905_1 /TAXON_ID=2966 /ORGANISM="Noctiluca scintillans" /LENGTH=85 /DNA_ID=CAMNT_0039387015 /DNA_START=177 /DNA_END=431 /DNA_ORIENTATION=-
MKLLPVAHRHISTQLRDMAMEKADHHSLTSHFGSTQMFRLHILPERTVTPDGPNSKANHFRPNHDVMLDGGVVTPDSSTIAQTKP